MATKMLRLVETMQSLGVKSLGLMAAIAMAGVATSSNAAETVSFWYGPLQRSVEVSDLRAYAKTQQASPDLAGLLRFVKPANREGLAKTLQNRLPVDVVTASKLLDSGLGKALLDKVIPIFIRKDQAGDRAIAGGLVLAAASKEGLSLLTFLEAYPAQEINLDIPATLKLLKSTQDLQQLIRDGIKP
jgi:hypothetical protein